MLAQTGPLAQHQPQHGREETGAHSSSRLSSEGSRQAHARREGQQLNLLVWLGTVGGAREEQLSSLVWRLPTT